MSFLVFQNFSQPKYIQSFLLGHTECRLPRFFFNTWSRKETWSTCKQGRSWCFNDCKCNSVCLALTAISFSSVHRAPPWGSFLNYVDQILSIFDHLPPSWQWQRNSFVVKRENLDTVYTDTLERRLNRALCVHITDLFQNKSVAYL